MFSPVIIDDVFSPSDIAKLREIADSNAGRRVWYDNYSKRSLIQNDELESYFSQKLEPIAKAVFNDLTLRTSFSLYAKYSHPESWLSEHLDRDACTYTLDYCLSAKSIWPVNVDGKSYSIAPNQALAFMGMESIHGRKLITDPGNNEVEMVFFHFVPENHWYFNHCADFYPDTAR